MSLYSCIIGTENSLTYILGLSAFEGKNCISSIYESMSFLRSILNQYLNPRFVGLSFLGVSHKKMIPLYLPRRFIDSKLSS